MIPSFFNQDRTLYRNLLQQLVVGLTPDEPELVRSDETICDAVDWIEQNFFIEETFAPITLAPYQRACLREATRRVDGKFVYDLVLWSDIKKSAKSTIAAAVVLWRAFNKPRGKFRIVANDQKQAMSRVFGFIVVCLQLNRQLGAQASVNKLTITLDNGSVIEAVAIDPKGEAGGADDMVEFTELHAATSKAALQMWAETTISPLKHGYAQRWVDTYAGHTGESPILEPLFQTIVNKDNRYCNSEISDDVEVYRLGRAFCLWNKTPRLAWQSPEYYASETTVLAPAEFSRMHGNEWVSSVQQFVPIEWWDACRTNELPVNRHNEVVIALDAAVDNDCFATVALSRHGDKRALQYCRKWTPPKNGKLEFKNHANKDDIEYPMGELRRLCKLFNVICITYDPYQLESFASECRSDGLGLMEPFLQGQPRLIADKQCYDFIRDRMFIHRGEPDIREHIMNANSTAEDKDTLRIIKRSQALKIDLAVALSMANDAAGVYLPG